MRFVRLVLELGRPARVRSAIASSIAMRVPDPTEKCAVWAASPMRTTLIDRPWPRDDGRELPPDAAVGDERMARELFREQLFEKRGALGLGRAVEPGGPPRLVAALDDERRVARLVFVGVDPPQAVFAALEVERERRKRLRRPQPYEAIGPNVARNRQVLTPSRPRIELLAPSAPTTRSAPAMSFSDVTSDSKWRSIPAMVACSCNMRSSV